MVPVVKIALWDTCMLKLARCALCIHMRKTKEKYTNILWCRREVEAEKGIKRDDDSPLGASKLDPLIYKRCIMGGTCLQVHVGNCGCT